MIGSENEASSGKYDGDGRCTCTSGGSSSTTAGVSRSRGTARPSSSSVYLRCHSSSRASTSGTSAKLYSGGGDGIVHSRVRASHGSAPTLADVRREVRTTL